MKNLITDTENKKIDVIVKYFLPVIAGIEMNVMETYSRLAKKGWDVTIHTSKDTYLKKNHLPKLEFMRNMKIRRYPFRWYGFFPEINYQETDLVSLYNFDMFPHMHILIRALIFKIFNRKNFKVLLTPHGGFNPEWRIFSKPQTFIKRSYHYLVANKLINLTVDGIRTVSDWEKKQMVEHGIDSRRIFTIVNGLEDEAYMDIDRSASAEIKKIVSGIGKYILQIGRIYKIKNYETTIKALAMLPEEIKYVIAGPIQEEKRYIENLYKLINGLGLKERVIFVGVIKGVDKFYLIKHAQMMVHMAIWESFCNVVHEGLSQGTVCIVANNTALSYLIKNGKNGYLAETYNTNKLAQKIRFVLNNKNKRVIKDIESRSKKYGLENSWDKITERISDFYTMIVQQRLILRGF